MKKEIFTVPYSRYVESFSKYYPSFITKDRNGLYGICSPRLGVEKSGIISGKDIFDKIGIPEFDLCEWQDDYVLYKLQKSLFLDLLNEVFDFKNEPWAAEEEEHFREEFIEHYSPMTIHNRRKLFCDDSKYIDAPFFYLAYPGHICLDVHCFLQVQTDTYEDVKGRMWRSTLEILSQMSNQFVEDDVLIVSKHTKALYRMDEGRYFSILQVVNLSSATIKYVEFGFALLNNKYPDANMKPLNADGEVTKQLIMLANEYEGDYIGILTKERTQDAYIKLSNHVKKELPEHIRVYKPYDQFSYDYATDDEIRKVKEILYKN